ncbi:hypothetical protein J6590_080994 [Homalodisca vitripennis]|nr:hypothetical protein J6590_080994 [Homalodisca vitripennis]
MSNLILRGVGAGVHVSEGENIGVTFALLHSAWRSTSFLIEERLSLALDSASPSSVLVHYNDMRRSQGTLGHDAAVKPRNIAASGFVERVISRGSVGNIVYGSSTKRSGTL